MHHVKAGYNLFYENGIVYGDQLISENINSICKSKNKNCNSGYINVPLIHFFEKDFTKLKVIKIYF